MGGLRCSGRNSAPPTLSFEVAEFSPGLEGVVAAETAVSEVDGANGRLIYRGGYLIEDLVPVAGYEEIAHLLWHGELPNENELDTLRQQMAAARTLNQSARGALMAMDGQIDPMDVLRTVVSAQGASKSLTKPSLAEAIALTAVFPTIVGSAYRRRQGKDKIGSADNPEKWRTEAHGRHERCSGFGHRVYRTYDPRAKILREMAKTASPELHKTAARTEEVALKILHDAHPERPNATNVDFWASVVLTGAGIPKELFTTLFATSRVSGWTAHVLESLSDLRIIRPASRWIGPEPGKKPLQVAKR